MASPTGLIGAAGEYYVAAELSRRDWLATVTIKNAPGTDVLAQHHDSKTVITLQTKTASEGFNYRLGVKDEHPGERDSEWYVFVSLATATERPRFFLVPRPVVAAIAYLEHRDWLGDVGLAHRNARRPRVENPSRSMRMKWIDGYLERWDLLQQPTSTIPYLGDPVFIRLARLLRLPRKYGRLQGAPNGPLQ